MKNKMLKTFMVAMLCCQMAYGQQNDKIKALSIFKNGQSFVIKESSAKTVDGTYKISQLPNALFGTYWFSGNDAPISSVTSKMEDFIDKQERKASSFLELLHANKGMEISVSTNDGKLYKGVVEDFDLPEEINSKLQLEQIRLTNVYEGQYGFDRIFMPAAPVLLLKMEGKWISIEPSSIKTIEFSQKPNRTTTASIAVRKPIITIHFSKTGKQDFRYMYLQTGLSWKPVYKLQLLSETEGRLSLQAEMVNTVEDIVNTSVDFVVGVPNFSQATSLATLLDYSKTSGLEFSATTQFRNDFSNARMVTAERSVNDVVQSTSVVTGTENEDMYFYTLKNVSLQKDSRAQFPLFTEKVKISHFYKCELPVSPFGNYQLNADDLDDNTQEEIDFAGFSNKPLTVAHYIELYNQTAMPFTSGPVLMLQGGAETPVAQDLLPFVSKGGHTSIYVTASPDVLITESEKISKIQRGSKKLDSYTYALVTVKGTINIRNSKSKPIDLKLQKQVTGKMQASSAKYTTAILGNQNDYGRVGNANQRVSFSTVAAANGKSQVSYSYQVYLREH